MTVKKIISLLALVFLVLPLASAAHYIVGVANDALDGTGANDFEVVLWNPSVGIQDNFTDTVGVNGNSGVSNVYLIDCEMLSSGCSIDDVLNVKIFAYPFSETVGVTVTGAGFDAAPNITLNSPPNVSLVSPENFGNTSLEDIVFNCSFSDLDSNSDNVSLYGNWSGTGWHLNETKPVSGSEGSITFTKNLVEGNYKWGCSVSDNLSASSFSENNFTLTVDRTPPSMNSINLNESYICGTDSYVRVTCNTDDLNGISNVVIQSIIEGVVTNYSADFLSGDDYYKDISAGSVGNWSFNCIAFDFANNSDNLTSEILAVYSGSPDLLISPPINFSNSDPIENENVLITTTVSNHGCGSADNFLVGFYEGSPLLGAQIGNNQTISVSGLSNTEVNISWSAKVGHTNVFVFADVSDLISEYNESNNELNQTIDVGVWQEFYGNVSGIKILSDYIRNNITLWTEEENIDGNVFITDLESDIDWLNLFAIGKNKAGGASSNDFAEIDSSLGMSDFKDSVEIVFSGASTRDFFIHKKNVTGVPVVNSTDGSSFVTGILWDGSDSVDSEYDSSEGEDLVFIAQINRDSPGGYGVYDYELKVPVTLRNYDPANSKDLYFYYDLV